MPEVHAPPTSRQVRARNSRLTAPPLSASVAADHRPVHEVADADRKGNDAERGNRPDVTIRLDARDQPESSDVAECPADEQNAGTAGTRRLVQFRLHRNVDSAGNRREP